MHMLNCFYFHTMATSGVLYYAENDILHTSYSTIFYSIRSHVLQPPHLRAPPFGSPTR